MPVVQKVSLQHLASCAGLSKATVSRALRNDPRQSRATCARIQDLAHKLGYRAHPLVTALMTEIRGRRRIPFQTSIALLTTGRERHSWRNSQRLTLFVEGVRQRIEQLDYVLDEIWVGEPGMTEARVQQILDSRSINGVLVMPFDPDREFNLELASYAAATTGYSCKAPNLHRSAVNYQDMIDVGFGHLRRRGYRRIGLVSDARSFCQANDMLAAAHLMLRQMETVSDRVPFLLLDRGSDADSQRTFESWFGQNRPDVIMDCGLAALCWIADLKLRVPEDLGYVSLDLTGLREPWCTEALKATGLDGDDVTGFNFEWSEVGEATVDLIVDQINRNECGVPHFLRHFLVAGAWHEGATVDRPALREARCPDREVAAMA